MRFAIFKLRKNPYSPAVFDVEAGNPPTGKREDWDCAGVFEVIDGGVSFYKDERGNYVLCIDGSGEKDAPAILAGELADQHSGNPAPINTLWRPNS